MSPNSAPYLIPFMISALLSFGLAFHAIHYYGIPGARPFSVLATVQCVWTSAMILELVSPTLLEKRFWDSLQWGLIYCAIIAVFWFTQSLVNPKRKTRVPYWLLAIFPAIFMTIAFADPLEIYPNERLVYGMPFNTHEFGFDWVDWVGFVYIYSVLIYCIITLYLERQRTDGLVRRRLTWAFIGISVQSIMYAVLFLANVTILGQRDSSPFTFLVGNILMSWGLFRNGVFELGPMARSQVVETMSDAFIVTDEIGKIVDMNRIAQKFAPSNWRDLTISDAFSDWSIELKHRQLKGAFTHDFVRVIDGHPRSLELQSTPLIDQDNHSAGFLVLVRDISNRKSLENALAASEARYRTIIDSMAEGILIYDQDGSILTCNNAAEKILDLPAYVLQGRNILELSNRAVHEDGSPFPVDQLPSSVVSRTNQPVRDVLLGLNQASGTLKWLSINVQPFDFNDQNMTETQQAIVSFRDVTELRRMQAEANRAEIAQEQARLLAQFVQCASHEFRTPLSVVGTSVYLMSRQPDPDRRKSHADIAEREIKRLASLMDTLVNLAQLDSGTPLERFASQIDSLVNGIVTRFAKTAKEHHITLQVTAAPSLPNVEVDSNYLTMGIEQVIDNALRYTPDHGRVDVTVLAEAKHMVIKVQDTGIGIKEEELEHIFDRFWRHDTAHSTPGFGLGLSIVQKVVERHGGTVEIDSKVGQGTLVTLRIPLKAMELPS